MFVRKLKVKKMCHDMGKSETLSKDNNLLRSVGHLTVHVLLFGKLMVDAKQLKVILMVNFIEDNCKYCNIE